MPEHLAGAAIENSMLGAAHALANPLTALAGVVHGHAVGMAKERAAVLPGEYTEERLVGHEGPEPLADT